MLLTHGAAVAHKHLPGPQTIGDPICVYVGRLTCKKGLASELREKGPVRGSVIGGSALVDSSVTETLGAQKTWCFSTNFGRISGVSAGFPVVLEPFGGVLSRSEAEEGLSRRCDCCGTHGVAGMGLG